ncbi:MAG: bifunctional [glutamine synthetase] adenylyltransferase/[glutamine synthetase]-adenylyl-L-tyrosine phosphorylase [Alphaproteobacteria bacterium]|nr:bifunctional [glutamine synthetase] adenylyltransferase/[glutamine synthetase]-adenylyl-L-tyrosine phosphorylase [Alphaproteobacteria bacterium]
MRFAINPDTPFHPRSSDRERIERGRERVVESAARQGNAAIEKAVDDVLADPLPSGFLDAIFGNSPFLTQCIAREIDFLPLLMNEGPDRAFDTIRTDIEAIPVDGDAKTLDAALRTAKRRAALVAAVADLSGAWPLETVTGTLSDMCERALSAATAHHLRHLHDREILRLPDPDVPQTGSGFVVLGMGKLGAYELNYSSDIDLIVLFDGDVTPAADPLEIQQHFIRMTRALVKSMEERTGEGYVFRTDLRLRPDPGATPVALSTLAAEAYYESLGQNWERAAMIKARPVAGDREAGQAFLQALQPFIWRRHLDFAAIEDIQSIKRQIHAHKGGSTVAVAGHNVKLGRGGIREVEFFAQTQQLIWGGRDPAVRIPQTVAAINALVEAERVAPDVARDMIAGYRFLRTLEHRLQMVDDQQTHSLPDTDDGLRQIAEFMGYPDRDAFERDLLHHLRTIESHYADLFEESGSLGGSGVLSFTGGEDHPDTIRTLTEMGFKDPQGVSATVRGWHHGRYRAMRSTRSRELLTEIMPALLEALSQTANPDTALRRFDEFLSVLPAGVQLFSLFQANPPLLKLVAEIMGGAPRLSEWLGRNPLLLDGVLEPDFFDALPDAEEMRADLDARLARAADMQDILDIARRWTNDAKFQVGVSCDIDRADLAFSDIADTVIRAMLPHIEREFAAQHGRCPGEGFAVLALGKLGGRELSATSDLDLVFLYDATGAKADTPAMSDGPKPLSITHYYQRLGQRVVNALTSLTGEGRLYEVDMRLRPSGNAGPLSVSLESFSKYQRESAWTWEHLALTRARVVSATDAFKDRIEVAIRDALVTERPDDELLVSVADMRRRIAQEHGTESHWNVKHVRGGLVDCEFMAQYLQLRHAHEHPDVLSTGTVTAYRNLASAGLLPEETATALIDATRLWRRVQGLLRLTLEGPANPDDIPLPLQQLLADAAGRTNFEDLDTTLARTAEAVHQLYQQIIEVPADAARATMKPEQEKD